MLGFVSALSSAVAVMILIMTTLLINLGTTMLLREKSLRTVRIDQLTTQQENRNDARKLPENVLFGGLSLAQKDLQKIKDSKVPGLIVYCQYGSNLSQSVATKISTLNYLRLKKVLGEETEVILLPPSRAETINSCFVEIKND